MKMDEITVYYLYIGFVIFFPVIFFYFLMRGLEISNFQRYFTFISIIFYGIFSVMYKEGGYLFYLWIWGPFVGYFSFIIGTYIEEVIKNFKTKNKNQNIWQMG